MDPTRLLKDIQMAFSKQQEAFDVKLREQKEEYEKAIQILEEKNLLLLEQVSSYESCLNKLKTTGENSGKSIQSVLKKYHAPQTEQRAMDSALEKTSAEVGQSSKPVEIENAPGLGTSTAATNTEALLEVAGTGSANESGNGNADKESSSNDQKMMETLSNKRGIRACAVNLNSHVQNTAKKSGNFCLCGKQFTTKNSLSKHIARKNSIIVPPLE